MVILNEAVEHFMFGSGIITEVEDNRIWVKFEDNIGTKIFLYPDAFEKFIKAVNPTVENCALKELRVKQEQIELERKEKEHEAAELERELVKMATAKKKPAARSTKKKS